MPDNIADCEQGFLDLLSIQWQKGKNDEVTSGKLVDVLQEAPDAVIHSPKEAV